MNARWKRRRHARGRGHLAIACIAASVLLNGCHSIPPPTPLDQLTAQEAEGHHEFQAHCAMCHYERTGKALQGPSLRGVFKKPYLPSGAPSNDERVTDTILHGHALMPAQPYLEPDSIAAILSYLHTV